jgi:cytoskeletal protein CcmA (bactofilin family)
MGLMGRVLGYLGLGSGDDSRDRLDDGPPAWHAPAARAHDASALGARLSFRGDLSGEGDFQIAGRFEGEINVSGRVVVMEGAQVDANISALGIVIGGTVRGNLSAATRVEILPTGALTGSLKTGSFTAADGASVKGEVWVEPGNPRGGPAGPVEPKA